MKAMRRYPRLVLVPAFALVSFLISSCATSQEGLPVEELVGCWYFASDEAVDGTGGNAAGNAAEDAAENPAGGAADTAGDRTGGAAGGPADGAAGARASDLRLPLGIRLTDRALEGWPAVQQLEGVRVAATLTPQGERDHPFGFWRPFADGDSVHVGYPAGGGLAMDLDALPEPEREGEAGVALAGAVRPVGDVLRPGSSGDPDPRPVRLSAGRCPQG